MLKTLSAFILLVISSMSYSQFYTSTQISTINSTKAAFEGDLYLDTLNNNYYIGLTTGELSKIGMDSLRVTEIIQTSFDSVNGTIFPIWAERSSALGNNNFEWAYGNGDASQASFGIIIPTDCELFAVGLTVFSGSAEVEVYKNGISTSVLSGTASPNTINTSITPLKFSKGDVVNFRTITASGASDGGKAVAWFRVNSKPNYDRIYGGSVPNSSVGEEQDEYLNTSTGDLFVKQNGSWVFQTNLKGISGASSVRSYIQVSNTVSLNINNGTTIFSWLDPVPANAISNDLTNFTLSNDGITVNKTATYKITVYQYQNGTAGQRTNASIRLTKNGTIQNGHGANAYIRAASPHEQSTASFAKLVSLAAGEKIGFINVQEAVGGLVTCPANTLVFMVEEM